MTPDGFVERWKDSGGAELANSQSFLKELCDLLDVPHPDPTRSDSTSNRYVFEKAVDFNNGDGSVSHGRIDLFRSGCFVLESKQGSERKAVEAAEACGKKGIMINTIGIGSLNGVPIPIIENGVIKGYRKDRDGQTVVTKLNSDLLKQIAGKANGVFVQASQSDVGLGAVLAKIGELDKAQLENKMYTDYEDQYQWFIGLALILFFIEFIISARVSEWFKKLNLFQNAVK